MSMKMEERRLICLSIRFILMENMFMILDYR